LAITWSKLGVKENLKLQNHSNNYELSENAIKMTFFLISGQKIIMKGCARQNGQVASRQSMHPMTIGALDAICWEWQD
jgi:hypothetical protein